MSWVEAVSFIVRKELTKEDNTKVTLSWLLTQVKWSLYVGCWKSPVLFIKTGQFPSSVVLTGSTLNEFLHSLSGLSALRTCLE